MGKDPKHDSHASSTQDSVKPMGSHPKPYKSGANVHRGGAPGPSKPAPVSGPKTGSAG